MTVGSPLFEEGSVIKKTMKIMRRILGGVFTRNGMLRNVISSLSETFSPDSAALNS